MRTLKDSWEACMMCRGRKLRFNFMESRCCGRTVDGVAGVVSLFVHSLFVHSLCKPEIQAFGEAHKSIVTPGESDCNSWIGLEASKRK